MNRETKLLLYGIVLFALNLIALLILCFLPLKNFEIIPAVFSDGHYYLKTNETEEIYYFHNGQMYQVFEFEKIQDYFLVKTEFDFSDSVNFYHLKNSECLLEHLIKVIH